MPGKKESKSGMIDFLMNHSKKFMITLSVIVILTSVSVVAAVWFLGGSEVAATYGNKKVLKSDYADFKSKCESFYNYSSDSKTKKECSKNELEDLILRKALETEADKRGITVSDAEINKKYTALIEPYGTEQRYLETIKNAFGYTPEYVKSNIKRDILKEKLAPYLLKQMSVSGVVVRYDWSGDSASLEKDASLAKDKLEKEFYPLLQNGSKQKDMEAKISDVAKRDGDPWNLDPVLAYVAFNNLNEATAQDTFAGKEDWENISKLQKNGGVTAVFKSSAGYMAAYRLDGSTTGQYTSWDSYKQDILKKAKTYSFDYKYHKFAESVSKKVSGAFTEVKKMAGIKSASAFDCSTQHFSRMNGYIVDGSNTSHGIVANVSIAPGSIGTWPKCSNPQEGGAITVNSNYAYYSGVNYYNAGMLQLGWQNDGSKKYLSCWVRWNVTISAQGFNPISYTERSVTSNGVTTNLDKPLSYGGKTGEGYSGDYQAENTNDNTWIYLAPIAAKGYHDQVDGSVANNNWTAYYNTADLTAQGYDTSKSSHSCEVTLGWACDPINWNYQSGIHLYEGSQTAVDWNKIISSSISANLTRTSGFGSACGGSLNHGFAARIPEYMKDNTDRWIWAYAFRENGLPYLIGNSPQKMHCPAPITDLCPSVGCVVSPTNIKSGETVKVTWARPAGVTTIDILQTLFSNTDDTVGKPGAMITGASGTQRTFTPSSDVSYALRLNNDDNKICPCGPARIKVSPGGGGGDNPVPPGQAH